MMYEVEIIQRKFTEYGEHDEEVVGAFFSLREAMSFIQMAVENFGPNTKATIAKKEEK